MALPSRSLRRLLVLAGLLLVVCGLIVQRRSQAAKLLAEPASAWQPGDYADYSLEMKSRVSTPQGQLVDFTLTGVWRMTALEAEEAATSFRGTLQNPKLVSAIAKPDEVQRFEKAFGQGVLFFDRASDGTVRSVRVSADVPTFVESVLKSIVAYAQFVAPDAARSAWESRETDTVGEYMAKYQLTGDGVEKHKLKYTRVDARMSAAMTALPPTDVVSSVQLFHFADKTCLKDTHLSERTRVTADGPMPSLTSETEFTLRLGARGSSRERVAGWLAQRSRLPEAALSAGPSRQAMRSDVDLARTANVTLDGVLKDLLAAQGSDEESKKRHSRHYAILAALLRMKPDAVRDATRKIKDHDASASTLIDALGDAGSADAQSALVGLAKSREFSKDDTHRMLMSLTFAKQPTAETVRFLESLVDDAEHAQQARLGLGANAYQLGSSDPGLASEAEETLKRGLAAAKDPADLEVYLKALGNAGRPATLSVITPYLTDANPSIRAAALRALRRMSAPGVDEAVARGMTDSVAFVRSSAVAVASQRSPSAVLVNAIRSRVLAELDERVRYEAVRVCVEWSPHAPALRELLRLVASSDSSERTRQLALGALQRAK